MSVWKEGEPPTTGYYLVLVRSQSGKGNPWVFLAQVIVDPKLFYYPIYTDHHGGNGKRCQYVGGIVVAWCDPTAENFASAFSEIKEFYEARDAGVKEGLPSHLGGPE